MKRLVKSWVFWAFVAVPAFVTAVILIHEDRRGFTCRLCYSSRVDSQWRFGWEETATLPLGPVREVVAETRVHRDGWTGPHDHRWYPLSPVRGERIDIPDDGGLLGMYEAREPFRAFMRAKRDRGEVSPDVFMDTVKSPYVTVTYAAEPPEERARSERLKAWKDEFARQGAR